MPQQNIMRQKLQRRLCVCFLLAVYLWLGMQPTLRVAYFPSETLLEGAKFSFAGKGNEF